MINRNFISPKLVAKHERKDSLNNGEKEKKQKRCSIFISATANKTCNYNIMSFTKPGNQKGKCPSYWPPTDCPKITYCCHQTPAFA